MAAFLLNNEVKYNTSNSTLFSLNQVENSVQLDYLESIVLELLINNKNQLVMYKEFLSNWRSSEVSENSLSRVISLVRKKLKYVGLSENVIINTAKKGYTFVADVKYENLEVVVSEKKFKFKPTKPIVFTVLAVFLILMTEVINLKSKNSDLVNISSTSYVELLSNKNIKIELAYHDKTHNIAYTTKSVGQKFWFIEVLNKTDGQIWQIKEPNKNLGKPVWLNDSELAYRLYDETSCSIKKVNFKSSQQESSSIKLFPCNPNSYASALAKLGNNKLLITDAELNNTASSLFIGDLNTGQIKKIDIAHGGGAGFYNAITTQNSSLVALLSSYNGVSFKIQLFDSKSWALIWEESLNIANLSVGWNGSLLSFKNNWGGISIVEFDSNKEKNRKVIPTITPTYNVSTANSGILFTSGEFFSQELTYFDEKSAQVVNLTPASTSTNDNAVFYDDELIIYVSNKTGINQVWSYNIKTKYSKQLSKFIKHKKINNLATDANNELLAIQVNSEIELFSLSDDKELSRPILSFPGFNPEFFSDQLVFTNYDGESSNISGISIVDNNKSDINIKGGFVSKTTNGLLLYSKRYLPGIWRYNPTGQDELFLDLPSSSYQWLVNENHIFYKNDQGDIFQYNFVDHSHSHFIQPNCIKPLDFYGSKCISKNSKASESRLVIMEHGVKHQ